MAADDLALGLPPRLRPVEQPLLDEIAAATGAGSPPLRAAAGLLEQRRDELRRLAGLFEEYSEKIRSAVTTEQEHGQILAFAEALGAGTRRRLGDRLALRRWHGWDAMVDRYRAAVGRIEREMAFLLERIGTYTAATLAAMPAGEAATAWQRLGVEAAVQPFLEHAGDRRVRIAAFAALAKAAGAMPERHAVDALGPRSLRLIYAAAFDPQRYVWTQVAALGVLRSAARADFIDAVRRRFEDLPQSPDDLFVRRRMAEMVAEIIEEEPDLHDLAIRMAADPSPYVRQATARALVRMAPTAARPTLARLILDDPEPCVRIDALRTLAVRLPSTGWAPVALVLFCRSLAGTDALAARAAAEGLVEAHARLAEGQRRRWAAVAADALLRARLQAPDLRVRRWASRAHERLWAQADSQAAVTLAFLAPVVRAVRPGRSARLPAAVVEAVPEETFGRVLSVLAQDDFSLEVWRSAFGWRLQRGDRFRFRFWRFLHELRHSASDKRQGHRHLVGRVWYGRIIAPSGRLGELSPTKVPGEPLVMSEEASWRPYLPLPDHAVSAIDTGGRVRLYTPDGIVEMSAPAGLAGRLRARLRLSWRFAAIAGLRNWTAETNHRPADYAQALDTVGIHLSVTGYDVPRRPRVEVDPAVRRFFPLALPFGGDDAAELWDRLKVYFFSVFQNSLFDLLLFAGAVFGAFLVAHAAAAARMRKARRAIPLVIGGWGTRGKSGTERLKAAVVSALGYPVLSKTTGCEAMFVMGRDFQPLKEIFLFRPYDKATIWEQLNLTVLARRLGTKVFLWECMGLTPSYVRILQHQWMRDDLSTITNTYPDHEDIQGPAGHDIPTVMTNFIPKRSALITSEEEMCPILEAAAGQASTRFCAVAWWESAVLPPDVLARFPYEEHPTNIALVLRVARELGVEPAVALKEMADRVVPDIGVLKVYPASRMDGRTLEFVNGMSANERYGCLANWERTGFSRQDPVAEPGVMLTTVVNNRADREPRSKVFASILVNDIAADRHVLIGNNLDGLQGFIREAWEARMAETSLWRDDGRPPGGTLAAWWRWMRLPTTEAEAQARLDAMISGVTGEAVEQANAAALPEDLPGRAEILAAHERHLAAVADYAVLAAAIGGTADAALDRRFRAILTDRFMAKIVVVEDYHATGDDVNAAVLQATPPGLYNRVMGIQNIKGTGLDFVYRWQAWDRCHAACRQVMSRRADEVREGALVLGAFQEYGPLCAEMVRAAVATARAEPVAQDEVVQAQLTMAVSNLERSVAGRREQPSSGGRPVRPYAALLRRLLAGVEEFLDAGDAVRRRRKADRIYGDLADMRIGVDRAVVELQKLNKRQKGGWLLARWRSG